MLGDKTAAVHDTARSVVDAGGTASALQIDAGLETDVARLVARAQTRYGPLDVVFANAGISGGMAGIFELTPEAWTDVLRVNLIGPWLMVKHAGKGMADAGQEGSIICTASVAGMRSGAGGPAYSVSKAGVRIGNHWLTGAYVCMRLLDHLIALAAASGRALERGLDGEHGRRSSMGLLASPPAIKGAGSGVVVSCQPQPLPGTCAPHLTHAGDLARNCKLLAQLPT